MTAIHGDAQKFVEAIARLDAHDHVCLIYENAAEQFAAIAPYVHFGLERNQRCIYIADESSLAEVLDALRREGVPVETAVARGALTLVTARQAGLQANRSDQDAFFRKLDALIDQSTANGFASLRLAVEMTWTLGENPDIAALTHFKTRLNAYLPGHNCMAIGLYNRRRFSKQLIHDAILTHPLVICSGIVCRNFFYIPPGRFQPQQTHEDEVDRMLQLLLQMDKIENELRQSREMLHNLVRHSSSMFYTHTPDHVLTYVSPQSRQILGCEPDEAMVRWQEFLSDHPSNRLGIEATQRAIQTGLRQPPYELQLITRQGGRIWVQVDESPVVQDGQTVAIVGSVTDITQRRKRERELEALAKVSEALRTAETRADMLTIILEQVTTLLDADGAGMARFDPHNRRAVIEMTNGSANRGTGALVPLDHGIIGGVLATGRPYLSHEAGDSGFSPVSGIDPVHPAISCVPLQTEGMTIGALWIGRKVKISATDVRIQVAIADIAANALQREAHHEQTIQFAARLSNAYESTLEGWAYALELRDQETKGHTQRVTKITVRLARAMGIQGDELEHIHHGALLHDIGKMGIPDSILLKPGPLTEEEWATMHMHPQYALEMLSHIEHLRPALDIPYCHHEKWDGSGYPRGLKGEQIPLSARLFAVADVWDALNSDRPYRKAWPEAQALDYIRTQAGYHFDPRIVELFFKVMGYPHQIRLSHTGRLKSTGSLIASPGQD